MKEVNKVGKVISKNKRDVIVDGIHVQYFRKSIESSIGKKGTLEIIQAGAAVVENLNDPSEIKADERIGLMFGRIQSGKTNSYTGSIAVAADNKYKCFIVLTSDNLWLYNQTLSRLKRGLPGLSILGKEDWENNTSIIPSKLKMNGVVLVSTKNGTILEKLIEAIKLTKASSYAALIIDDEADQASLNTHAAKKNDDASPVNAQISGIREQFPNKTFIQVTATPQALFLQGLEHPYRPGFTILTEAGEGYVGGETFFGSDEYRYLSCPIEEDEINSLISTKVKSASKTIPKGLKEAICTFYIGATIKLIREEGEHFSFLCHVSLQKADHEHIRNIIQRFTNKLAMDLNEGNDGNTVTHKLLKASYNDLIPFVLAPPDFDEVIKQLAFFAASTDIQVLNTDAKTGSEPRYDSCYNILIGGTKLGRGVTIERLLVTYYGRQAKNPQMDTVLQHARMYGYRQSDLDVSRIYLPKHLAERFRLIYESEEALRDIISRYKDEGYRGIWLSKKIKATRSNVLDPNELGTFVAGKTYFPHKPLYKKAQISASTTALDELLRGKFPSEPKAKAVKVPITFIMELLEYTKCENDSSGLWSDERIIMALERLKNDYQEAYLIVREDRKLSRKDTPTGLGAVYQSSELKLAGTDLPTLLMLRQNGKKSPQGWDDQEFWIPALRFPEGNYALMFNLS